MTHDEMLRLERVWATDAVVHARALASLDPSWGTQTFPVGDGWAVLTGAGLYVNQVLAAGIETSLQPEVIDSFEDVARVMNVAPAFEVSELTRTDVMRELNRRGYVVTGSVSVLIHASGAPVPTREDVVIETIPGDRISEWQELAALGWGHSEPAARKASDAFSAAASAAGQTMLIARHFEDGRPLGCASLSMIDGVAILGGMSTLPAERGRGVQTALVAHRLAIAEESGCDIAGATALVGGDSERNLMRLGFEPTLARHTTSLEP